MPKGILRWDCEEAIGEDHFRLLDHLRNNGIYIGGVIGSTLDQSLDYRCHLDNCTVRYLFRVGEPLSEASTFLSLRIYNKDSVIAKATLEQILSAAKLSDKRSTDQTYLASGKLKVYKMESVMSGKEKPYLVPAGFSRRKDEVYVGETSSVAEMLKQCGLLQDFNLPDYLENGSVLCTLENYRVLKKNPGIGEPLRAIPLGDIHPNAYCGKIKDVLELSLN